MRRPPTRKALVVAAVLIVALALRVAEVQRTSYRPINDAGSYLTLASQIAHTGGYPVSHRPGSGAGGTMGPTAYFPPAYPYFLAGVDLIDGHATRRGSAVEPARLSQALLGTVTVALVGLVAFEAVGELAGLIALALAAIYPVLIGLSATLVAENLLTALVLGAVYAALRARRRGSRRYVWIAAAGVLTGLATLTHENGAVIVLPLIVAVWSARPRLSPRALMAPALLVAAALVTVAPWTIRNAIDLHRFIPVSDETGITLVGTYNPASAAYRPVPYKWRLYYGIPGERPLIRQSKHLTEPALSSRLQTQALNYIGDHPFSPVAVAYHNTLRLLELEGSYAWRASAAAIELPSQTAQIGVVSFWVLCLLALAGAFTRAARAAPRWLWFVPVLLWLSVALVNAETPRFREPVDPFLILLAACAIAAAVRAVAARSVRTPVGGKGRAPVAARPTELVEMRERLA
ncbi:MAG TPA: glycosyltransferase family 39 protein [Solirubrobacteraceae bacterium]|nr:glycosyltransferase family 39 protein [Solirubrobacteraceae bacterium]